MTAKVIDFQPWHIGDIDIQERQMCFDPSLSNNYGEAYSLVDGRIIACAGVIEIWEGRYLAWAILSKNMKQYMVLWTRKVMEFLDSVQGRIEMLVEYDFPQAHRWAKQLGFNMEAERMNNFGRNGEDFSLYARING